MTHMQPYQLDAWLGDTELTAEQREAFESAISALEGRYPGRDHGQHPDEDDLVEAMSGALMVILGDDTIEGLGVAWQRARAAEREAMARLTGAITVTAQRGTAQTTIAARSGVNRMTVRKALGK